MNNNQNISSKVVNTLVKLGCKNACISPGARNSCLAINLGKKINSYNLLDERAAGYMALGIAKYTNSPVIINCTSGTALANLFPSIIEARMSEIPMIILTADRPKEMINIGENQTIYQKEIFGEYVLDYQGIDATTLDIENIINSIYHKSIGITANKDLHEKGPVHINVHLDEPNINQKIESDLNIVLNKIKPMHSNSDVKINDFKKPLIICGQSNLKNKQDIIFSLSERFNIPILTDISSNINSHPNKISYYDTFISDIKPDTIFRFGKKPISKKLNALIKEHSKNTYLVRDQKIFNDDAINLISYNQLSNFIDKSTINIDEQWINSIKRKETISISKIDDLIDKSKSLNEYSLAYHFLNQVENKSNIFIGNSIIIRAFNLLLKNTKNKDINVFSNRGASGIDGNIATSAGISICSNSNRNYLILGDQAFMHDIGSLNILQNQSINLTIIVINNSGGGIFDYLPISNDDNMKSYKKFIRSDHNYTFNKIIEAYGLSYKKVNSLSDFNLSSYKNNTIIEVKIDRNESLNFYQKMIN